MASQESRTPTGAGVENDCSLKCEQASTCAVTGSHPWGTKDGMHCECPNGFAGVRCELAATFCGVGEHLCLGGSTCVKDEDDEGYRCQCDQADKANASTCQNHGTEFCTPVAPHIEYAGGMAVAAFCVNDGKCVDVVLDDEVYPVCECPLLFTGPHCEFLKSGDPELLIGSSPKAAAHSEASEPHKTGLIMLLVFLAASLLVSSLFVGRQVRRVRRRRHEEVASTNLQGFRDGGVDNNINFAESPNKSMLFHAFTDRRGSFTESRGAFADPRGAGMKRKDSIKRGDDFTRGVQRSDSFDRGVHRRSYFNRRAVQRTDSYDAPGPGKFTHSDKGKLHDIQFV